MNKKGKNYPYLGNHVDPREGERNSVFSIQRDPESEEGFSGFFTVMRWQVPLGVLHSFSSEIDMR